MKRFVLLVMAVLLFATSCTSLRDAWQPTAFFVSDKPIAEQTLASPVAALQASGISDHGSRSVPLSDAPPEYDQIVMNFIGDVMLAAETGDDGFWSFNLFAYDTPK